MTIAKESYRIFAYLPIYIRPFSACMAFHGHVYASDQEHAESLLAVRHHFIDGAD